MPVQITFDEHVGVLVADGKNFTLKNVHWHSPSEHRIEGEQYALSLSLSAQAQARTQRRKLIFISD